MQELRRVRSGIQSESVRICLLCNQLYCFLYQAARLLETLGVFIISDQFKCCSTFRMGSLPCMMSWMHNGCLTTKEMVSALSLLDTI